MDFFSNFLQQKVPKSGKELPVYYRKALCVSEILLIAYFFVCFFFYPLFLDVWIWFPLGFAAVTGAALWPRCAGKPADLRPADRGLGFLEYRGLWLELRRAAYADADGCIPVFQHL